MDTATLHYIYDPFCGWCYGAAPLVKAASTVLPVQAHGGGMMAGNRRQPVTPQLRNYVIPHDRRITQITGQTFGAAYFDGLLRDGSAVLDSAPPIAAILAADKVAGRGLDMLARLHVAHYVEGRRIADRLTLIDVGEMIGLDAVEFTRTLEQMEGEAVQLHIAGTGQMMARLGVAGFPSFVLEQDGQSMLLATHDYLGRPGAFRDWLQTCIAKSDG
jgi:putative protein-disulfide isomerase